MRLLMQFEKNYQVRYISHLDMQRLFQRAIRRAKLPAAYSQGFNPHLIISFACALPVGVCSKCEYVEIQLEKFVHPTQCMQRLNDVLPSGVRVVNAFEPNESYPNVGSIIALAEYTFTPKTDADHSQAIAALLKNEVIEIEKKTKKGLSLVNVRPMIHRLKQTNEGIKATLSCSNTENLRADVMQQILEEYGIPTTQAVRNAIFVIRDNKIEQPMEALK